MLTSSVRQLQGVYTKLDKEESEIMKEIMDKKELDKNQWITNKNIGVRPQQ